MPTLSPAAPHGAPAIWNPLAVAGWSVIFTPAFGAYLQMRNWQALGEPARAAAARNWLWASLAMLLLNILARALDARLGGESLVIHWVGFVFLALWCLAAAWPQARLVRQRYGSGYPRRPWDQALLGAVLGGVAYALASALVAFVFVALT